LSKATAEEQRKAIRFATVEQLIAWDADFEEWAHKNQLPPNGEGWRTWLMMAGRGFGKTRAGAEWIFKLANIRPVSIALIGATISEARSIMVEGVSGLLSIGHRHRKRLRWEPSLGRLTWPNGSEAKLFSGDNADGLRGPEHEFAWADAREMGPGRGGVDEFAVRAAAGPEAAGAGYDHPAADLRAEADRGA
jgi:phage terminase large subunit-like protein